MEKCDVVGKSAKLSAVQMVFPDYMFPPKTKGVSIRFLPTSGYFTMLCYLAHGYQMKPLEYVKWLIKSQFEFHLKEWGVCYERQERN